MTPMRKVSSDTPWEPLVGYSRAVAVGDFVLVSGCTSTRDGQFVHEGDAAAQTAQAIANVARALERLGAGLPDVVRTRMFVTDITRWREYGAAHGAAFGQTLPATSMLGISALVDPRMLVEVEAVAYKPGAGTLGEPVGGTRGQPAAGTRGEPAAGTRGEPLGPLGPGESTA